MILNKMITMNGRKEEEEEEEEIEKIEGEKLKL